MSDNKLIAEIKIYRNTLIDRYSAELVFSLKEKGHRVRRTCGGASKAELQHWLNNVAGGMEIHLEDAENAEKP